MRAALARSSAMPGGTQSGKIMPTFSPSETAGHADRLDTFSSVALPTSARFRLEPLPAPSRSRGRVSDVTAFRGGRTLPITGVGPHAASSIPSAPADVRQPTSGRGPRPPCARRGTDSPNPVRPVHQDTANGGCAVESALLTRASPARRPGDAAGRAEAQPSGRIVSVARQQYQAATDRYGR